MIVIVNASSISVDLKFANFTQSSRKEKKRERKKVCACAVRWGGGGGAEEGVRVLIFVCLVKRMGDKKNHRLMQRKQEQKPRTIL